MTYSASYPVPQDMKDIIENCTVGLGGVGAVAGLFGPHVDLVVIAPTWVGMVVALADKSGVAMDEQAAKKICMAVATGAGAFLAGTKLATTGFSWLFAIPSMGLSLVLGAAGNAALNAKFTHAFGNSVARYFLQTDNLPTSDVVVQVLLALIATQFGMPSPRSDVVA